ncbi:GvpL/GvpF family gas vesicle protein [Streptomyces sp. NPDC051322]|uniref:GvpL/GvpF family gas vesicle protein n=1 Tax=Streptomyces sp. NPDC051322 TaxID=3154645 RepID=UPI00344C02F7
MSTYVYAITAADHPVNLTDVAGVGEPAARLRAVGTKELTAVVSDAPADLRAKRRDLVAHQTVLEGLMTDGAALPMRFGLVGPDDDQVIAVLEQQRDAYLDRLKEVDGCREYNVKVARDEEDLLREIVTESDEIRELNGRTRQNPAAHDDKVALGELVSAEVQTRHERASQELVARLTRHAAGVSIGEPAKAYFLNASFLVRQEDAATFSQSVHEEAEARGDVYTFSVNGPLPPYSFV